MKILLLSMVLITLLVLTGFEEQAEPPTPAPKTEIAPSLDQALKEKWLWAQSQANQDNLGKYLLAYSINAELPEDVLIWGGLSLHFSNSRMRTRGRTLRAALLTQGFKLEQVNTDQPNIQKLALIWELKRDANGKTLVVDVRSSDLRLPVSLEPLPLYWLGEVNADASMSHVIEQYNTTALTDTKCSLIEIASLHKQPLPFLERVLTGETYHEIRAEAIEALTWVEEERAEDLLIQSARKEPALKVRSEAISALGQRGSQKAKTVLLELFRRESNRRIRSEVVESLAQWDDPEIQKLLIRAIWNDEAEDVREEALCAAVQDHRNSKLLEQVIEKHSDQDLRGTAICLYVKAENARALPLIKRLLHNAPEQLASEAVAATESLEEADALPLLRDVIAHHENREVRVTAIAALIHFPSAEALTLLRKLVDSAVEEERDAALDVLGDWPDDQGRKTLELLLKKYKT